MTWVLVGIGVAAGLAGIFFLAAWLVGRRLPTDHVVTATLRVARAPGEVFALLADPRGWPAWDKGVTSVDALPDRDGRPACRMHMGRNAFVLVTTRHEPPTGLALTIDDDHAFFQGRWEYAVAGEGPDCVVTLTEHGTVSAAIPRFFMKYLVDPAMYLKRHLRALATHLGESPRIAARRVS